MKSNLVLYRNALICGVTDLSFVTCLCIGFFRLDVFFEAMEVVHKYSSMHTLYDVFRRIYDRRLIDFHWTKTRHRFD